MFGRLKNKHATSSFWEKVSFRENTLSQEYIFVKELVDAADLYFKVRSAYACVTCSNLTVCVLYAGFH